MYTYTYIHSYTYIIYIFNHKINKWLFQMIVNTGQVCSTSSKESGLFWWFSITLEKVTDISLTQASVSTACKQPKRLFPHQELGIHSNSKLSYPAPWTECQDRLLMLALEGRVSIVISKFCSWPYPWSCLVMRPQLVAPKRGQQSGQPGSSNWN